MEDRAESTFRSKEGERECGRFCRFFKKLKTSERQRQGRLAPGHDLNELLAIAPLSMLSGGRTCVDMEDYGCACEAWLREFMMLENGIPSHDTFSRVFQLLAPSGLQKTLLRLAQNWADRLGEVVAVDSKVLRQSFEKASERSPTHLRQAFASEAKLTLAQIEVDGKSNEIPALPELLELIDLKRRTVTADAMHAARHGGGDRGRDGDHALALKRNQGTLHEDVAMYLDSPPVGELLSHQQVGKGPSRLSRGASRSAPRRSATTSAGCWNGTTGPDFSRLTLGRRQGGRGAASRRRLGEH